MLSVIQNTLRSMIPIIVWSFTGTLHAEDSIVVDQQEHSSNSDIECGRDRRCRIDRLKRRRRAYRLSQARRIAAVIEQNQVLNHSVPSPHARTRREWNLDAEMIFLGDYSYGLTGRYSWTPHLQVSATVADGSLSTYIDDGSTYYETYSLSGHSSYQIILSYLFSKSSWSPFGSIRFYYSESQIEFFSSASSIGNIGFFDDLIDSSEIATGGSNGTGELELHLVGLESGYDYQSLTNGFHARIGITYFFPLFVGFRDSITGANLPAKSTVSRWATTVLDWGINLSIGWSI